jgi:hypothetical protein
MKKQWHIKKQLIQFLLTLFVCAISTNNLLAQTTSKIDSIKFENFKTQTGLDSFVGKQKIKILYRASKNVSNLDLQGEILITDYGVTLTNIMLFEDVLRCAFDQASYIPLEKGRFPIRALKSIYGDGVFSINLTTGVGSVSLPYSKNKNETISFVVIK